MLNCRLFLNSIQIRASVPIDKKADNDSLPESGSEQTKSEGSQTPTVKFRKLSIK